MKTQQQLTFEESFPKANKLHESGSKLAAFLHFQYVFRQIEALESTLETEKIKEQCLFFLTYYENFEEILSQAKKTALEVQKIAHAPFSNFQVGSVLIAEDGSLWQGCNVECSSHGLTLCAERTALVSAVAHGRKKFAGIIVATDTKTITPPCGACRQMLFDFAKDSVVIMITTAGKEQWSTLAELLPLAFSAEFLSK